MRRLERDSILSFIVLLIAVFPINAQIQYNIQGNSYVSDYIIDSIAGISDDPVNSLLELYNNSGFPFASIRTDSALMKGHLTSIYMTIIENGRYRISGIRNLGSIRTSMLNNMFDFDNAYYSDSLVRRGLSYIYSRLGINASIVFSPYLADDELYIQTDIDMQNYSYISGLFATSFSSGFFGFLDIELYSPQGFGRQYRLFYERDSDNLTELNAHIMLPYLTKLPLSFSIDGFYEEYDSITAFAGADVKAVYLAQFADVYAGIGRQWMLSGSGDENENYIIATTGLSAGAYAKTDAYAEFSHYNGTYSFGRTKAGISDIFNINRFFVKPGLFIDVLVYSDSVMLFQKERTGGTSSIRGLAENALIFTNIIYANMETGFSLSNNIRVFLLCDAAMFNENTLSSPYEGIVTYGTGFDFYSDRVNTSIYAALPYGSDIYSSRLHIMLKYLF